MVSGVDKLGGVPYEGRTYRIAETAAFLSWLESLRDRRASGRIIECIKRASNGNFGDVKSAGGGVSELRIDYGPGYRVYFFQRDNELVILLCGGDKRTQNADISEAKRLKAAIERADGTSSI